MRFKDKPPKRIVKGSKILELKTTYVLLDDEGDVIRWQNHQFPHAKLRRTYVEILDLDTLEPAPF